MYLYLDWNVFNNLEKRNSLVENESRVYHDLYDIVTNKTVICPYSNAHLNDLIRGYKKDPSYIQGHFNILEEITGNLCICQYWKQSNPLWHSRMASEFFYAAIKERELEWESFDDLINEKYEIAEGITISPLSIRKPLLQLKPIPSDFKKIYQADPIFNIIYPQTRIEMTEYALCCDLYNFSVLLKKDFSLYRSLRKFLIQTINKYRQNNQILKMIKTTDNTIPKYLDIDTLFEQVKTTNTTGVASAYDKFFDVFFRYDLKGYKGDNQFPNMIDDALHSYYAAHCDYFITNDDRCKYKAEKTYERLKITTTVLTAKEFIAKVTA